MAPRDVGAVQGAFYRGHRRIYGERAFGKNVWVANDLCVASIDLAIQDHILPGLE